jgi:hypothetical protein
VSDKAAGPLQLKTKRPRQEAAQASRRIDRIAPWVDVLSKVATVAVLVLAVLQFIETGREKQRERAMQLVDQWVDEGNPERLARISGHLKAVASEASQEIAALPQDMQARAWDNVAANMFKALSRPEDDGSVAVRNDIDALLRFFTRAEVCVASGLCDMAVARAYFGVEARSIRKELDPLFAMERAEAQPAFGLSLDRFLAMVER